MSYITHFKFIFPMHNYSLRSQGKVSKLQQVNEFHQESGGE